MAKQTTGRKQVLSIAMDPELVKRVDELADAVNQSRSAFIERCVRDAVEQEGDAIKAFQHPVLGPALIQAFSNREVLKGMAEVMGQDLTDQQLLLFRQMVSGLTPPEVPSRPARRAAVAKVRKTAKRANGGQGGKP